MSGEECFWIYILEMKNGHYYTGYTSDLIKRYRLHLKGAASKLTRSFKPTKLAQCWKLMEPMGAALRVEALIKNQKREIKNSLVENPEKLKRLILEQLSLDLEIKPVNPGIVESEFLSEGSGATTEKLP
ncbi:hypothetical protein ES703_58375 [subsurface metagenome]